MELPRFEKYSPEKIQRFIQYLNSFAEKGKAKDFEVIIDGFKVIHRTNDPSEFNVINEFINPSTKVLEIVVYTGGSQYNTRHTFTFEEPEKPKEAVLNGLDIESRINEAVKRERREWEYEYLQKECREWKEYAEDLEKDMDKMEEELIQLKSNQSPLHGVLGELGSSFVTSLVKKNPNVLAKIPGLAGLVETGEAESTNEVDQGATFVPSQEENAEAREAVQFIKYLKKKLNEDQFGKVMMIINTMVDKPEQIESVLNHLGLK